LRQHDFFVIYFYAFSLTSFKRHSLQYHAWDCGDVRTVSLGKYTAALHNYIRYDVLTGDYNADYIITKVMFRLQNDY